jgi:hypothetical protein
MPSANKRRNPAVETVRGGLVDLLNDRSITDRQRLRYLEKIGADISYFIGDLRSRIPEERKRREGPDGGLCYM